MKSASRIWRTLGAAALVLGTLAYPFWIARNLGETSPRTLSVLLLAATAVLAFLMGGKSSAMVGLLIRRFGLLVAVAVTAAATDHPLALQLLPSLTSLWLLAMFAASLREDLSIVERFASTYHDEFPDFLLPYCRRVTIVWCAFFAGNALVGAALALWAPAKWWAFYTGVLSYVLVGALAVGEYFFHKSRFRFYEGGPVDRVWSRFLPADQTALGRRTLQWQSERRVARKAEDAS